ncbi:hypothetical protein HanPI659440_Chr01g0006851 [Helianthus annuus]|nr:hypothetical protein HanPI659440_Chr01g0006841 [Helianthus annuus]KAJ0808756.1 hypothetical protein HanPI659440_Chr01g0006851 [Helianthus annuus]
MFSLFSDDDVGNECNGGEGDYDGMLTKMMVGLNGSGGGGYDSGQKVNWFRFRVSVKAGHPWFGCGSTGQIVVRDNLGQQVKAGQFWSTVGSTGQTHDAECHRCTLANTRSWNDTTESR